MPILQSVYTHWLPHIYSSSVNPSIASLAPGVSSQALNVIRKASSISSVTPSPWISARLISSSVGYSIAGQKRSFNSSIAERISLISAAKASIEAL